MKAQVLKSELVKHAYSVMSISSVQSYTLITKNIATDEIVKEVYLDSTNQLYDYFIGDSTSVEKKAMQDIVDSIRKLNLV